MPSLRMVLPMLAAAQLLLFQCGLVHAQETTDLSVPTAPNPIEADSAIPLPPADFVGDLSLEDDPYVSEEVASETPESNTSAPVELVPAPLRQAPALPESSASASTKADAGNGNAETPLPPFAFDPPTGVEAPKQALPLAARAQAGVASAIPIISIEARGPADAIVDQSATYNITISNLGETIAQQVVVDVSLPESARDVQTAPKCQALGPSRLRFRLGDLAEKQKQVLKIKLTPSRRGPVQLHSEVSLAAATALAVNVREANVEITASGPTQAGFGQQIIHKVTIKNVGDATAEDLQIEQLLPEKVQEIANPKAQKHIGSLGPGESREITFAAAAQTTGDITIAFVATGSPSIRVEANQRVEILRPLIEVATQGPTLNYVDREGVYAILVTNTGDAAAQNVEIASAIPEGCQVLAIDREAKFSASERTLTWILPSLPSGHHEVFRFKAKATAEGRHVHDVLVRGEGGLIAKARHLTEVISRADVSMQIADTPGPIEVGNPALFEVLVRNRGSKEAKNVAVAVELPNGLEGVRSRDYTVKDDQIAFPVITLPAGSQKVYRFEAVGSSAGDHVVKVLLRSDSLPREVTAEESIFFYQSQGGRRVANRTDD